MASAGHGPSPRTAPAAVSTAPVITRRVRSAISACRSAASASCVSASASPPAAPDSAPPAAGAAAAGTAGGGPRCRGVPLRRPRRAGLDDQGAVDHVHPAREAELAGRGGIQPHGASAGRRAAPRSPGDRGRRPGRCSHRTPAGRTPAPPECPGAAGSRPGGTRPSPSPRCAAPRRPAPQPGIAGPEEKPPQPGSSTAAAAITTITSAAFIANLPARLPSSCQGIPPMGIDISHQVKGPSSHPHAARHWTSALRGWLRRWLRDERCGRESRVVLDALYTVLVPTAGSCSGKVAAGERQHPGDRGGDPDAWPGWRRFPNRRRPTAGRIPW